MISSDKGNFKIQGEYKDIVFELNQILEYFVNKSPEVLGGALAVWGDKLEEVLSTDSTNIELLDIAKVIAEKYIKLRKEFDYE